jgi:hypothetical protein
MAMPAEFFEIHRVTVVSELSFGANAPSPNGIEQEPSANSFSMAGSIVTAGHADERGRPPKVLVRACRSCRSSDPPTFSPEYCSRAPAILIRIKDFPEKTSGGGTFALIANGQAGPNHPAAVGVLSF